MQTERTFEFILGNVPDASYIYSHSVFIHTNSFNDLKKKFSISAEYFYAKINGYIVKIEHRNHEKLLNIAAMGKIKKVQLKVANEQSLNFEYIPKLSSNFLVQIDFSIEYSATGKYFPEILEEDLEQAIKNYHNEDIINNGDKILVDVSPKNQSIDLKNNKVFLTLTATKIVNSDDQIESFGSLLLDTCYEFDVSLKNLKLISSNKKKNIIKKGYNFNDMGVGGMHDEINKIFRTAFVSRMHSNDTLKKFGVKHVKGILLYGPPGTGKTLIAKTLAKMLDSEECTVVNGPELFDKYVGETEKKIRELFVKAEKDEKENGENSGLHVIVFDEIDSICRSRGTISSGTGVHDSAVNQLLTKIDGVESLNNIIIIGMTNRKELIDDAILRPGRLEVHVEIGLPSYKERIEIINIHTKQMRENNLIDESKLVGLCES